MIEIINLHKGPPTEPYDFYVDRRTPVGNPYYMDGEKERDKVCDEYKIWFDKRIKMVNDPAFNKYIDKLIDAYKTHGRLRLCCWCMPKRCHSETIKEYILSKI